MLGDPSVGVSVSLGEDVSCVDKGGGEGEGEGGAYSVASIGESLVGD